MIEIKVDVSKTIKRLRKMQIQLSPERIRKMMDEVVKEIFHGDKTGKAETPKWRKNGCRDCQMSLVQRKGNL